MKPIKDKILVHVDQVKETTASGIFIPVSKRVQNEGEVLLIGPKVKHIKIGDRVRYYPHCGSSVEYDGKDCLILKEDGEIEIIL